jgi:hypothetical protein
MTIRFDNGDTDEVLMNMIDDKALQLLTPEK